MHVSKVNEKIEGSFPFQGDYKAGEKLTFHKK